MKNKKFLVFSLALLLISTFAFSGCTKDEEEEVADLPDTLVSIGEEEPVIEEVIDEDEEGIEEEVEVEEEEAAEVEEVAEERVTFGEGDQLLDGATSADGARVTSYTFGTEGNTFRFIWTVRGSDSKPIPKVQAKHNANDSIIVVFPDLESDYIAVNEDEIEMTGIVEAISWNRTGNESMYKFDTTAKKDFQIKSSLNPNEVILEIKLY